MIQRRFVLFGAILLVLGASAANSFPKKELPCLIQAEIFLKVFFSLQSGSEMQNRPIRWAIAYSPIIPEQVERAIDFYEAFLLQKNRYFPRKKLELYFARLETLPASASQFQVILMVGEPPREQITSLLNQHHPSPWIFVESPSLVQQGALLGVYLDQHEQVHIQFNAVTVQKTGVTIPAELKQFAQFSEERSN